MVLGALRSAAVSGRSGRRRWPANSPTTATTTSSTRIVATAVWSGAAIVDGTVYWGSGYDTLARKLPYNGNNNKFYAFSPNGR